MTTTVNVYLPFEDRQIRVLSVPLEDIKRFTYRPLKWLRYVTFAICGAHGHLSATPGGTTVDYSTSFDGISDAYHFILAGDYHFIDYNALDDQITSSVHTPRSSNFRTRVRERDGQRCVFTLDPAELCEVAHLLPKSKGNEYIGTVFEDRRPLYHEETNESGIDSVKNGILLRSDLHKALAVKRCALLNTPNFALDPDDIPRVEEGLMPSTRLTLQFLIPETGRFPMAQCDAPTLPDTGIPQPSYLILDFVYGVAVYHQWGRGGEDIQRVLREHLTNHFESIPPRQATPQSDEDASSEDDDANDPNYNSENEECGGLNDGDVPVPDTPQRERKYGLDMSDPMDAVLALSMLLKGTNPGLMAVERQKREEVGKLRAKEASRVKVEEWMQNSSSTRLDEGTEFQSNANVNLQPE